MQIIVKDNVRDAIKYLNEVQRRQVPYATSRALNDAAIDAQNDIMESVQKSFTNRKRWWLKHQPTGIKVQFSNKNKLRAAVFTDVYFAKAQEEGGNKTPTRGKNLAIPTDRVPKRHRARLIVKKNVALGITADTVLDTATGSSEGAWETLTGTTATVTDDGVLEFVVDCDGTTGWVNVDSFDCSTVNTTKGMKHWIAGLPMVHGDNATGGGGGGSVGYAYAV